ncbi:hemerythrin domain-containing protein [Gephyromycinifex aptenodytis]|uniref:hemerythrin domain-containing protein n=1 Tax=Gephyromycinifex aptenodytis TaxID=2716227 RepID=UPI001447E13F|nr:hemerythrin domain-containing protein [Gephyromycinifex aptenodytis]
MADFPIPRPTSGDIVDVIIDDHRTLESLLRDLRNSSLDRDAARKAFAALLIAHGEAEEEAVYPKFKRGTDQIGEHEAEHGTEEHAEGNQALLELLEAKGTDTQKYDDAAEKLSAYVYHHLVEEELTILNPAREELPEKARMEIGAAFLAARSRHLDADCGRIENVRTVVNRAQKDGLISEELPEKP